jgi:hypothetical protein
VFSYELRSRNCRCHQDGAEFIVANLSPTATVLRFRELVRSPAVLKKDIDASIIPSDDAFIGIVFRCWIALAKKIKTPVFERHAALLIAVKAPMFLRATFFERCPEFSFEVFKFHVCMPQVCATCSESVSQAPYPHVSTSFASLTPAIQPARPGIAVRRECGARSAVHGVIPAALYFSTALPIGALLSPNGHRNFSLRLPARIPYTKRSITGRPATCRRQKK